MNNYKEFLHAYVDCAAWTNEVDEISFEEFKAMKRDCIKFIILARDYMHGLDLSQCGHDFWLTRNGHGTGFWDRDYPQDIAHKLTKLSESFGEFPLFGIELTRGES